MGEGAATSPRPARRRSSRSTSGPARASRSRSRPPAQYFENAFFNPKRYDLTRVGRYKLNRKLGPEIERISDLFEDRPRAARRRPRACLSPSEILAAATYMLHLAKHMADGESNYRIDDQDHFANRRIRSVGELIQNQVRVGLSRMERVVRERMTTQDVEAITPQTLINIRPVVAAVKEFFGTSQLSQFMDQNNPLSGLAHKRRLSALGPGGLSRERAGFEVRDVHTSHYGRMCPIETPEGPNIGLIGALATYARVNEYGFIETPYRKVVDGRVTDEILYLAADEEEEHVIAQASAALDDDGPLHRGARSSCAAARREPACGWVRPPPRTARRRRSTSCRPSEVDLMDVSPKQIVSVSTALIPFVEHDDANRALMGANMQKQAVPLVVPEAPYIGTGVEARAARDAGDVVLAEGDGTVVDVSGDQITVEYKAGPEGPPRAPSLGTKVYRLAKFRRSNQNTCDQPEGHRRGGPEGRGRRRARRRSRHPQRRAGARQEPARRLHALGGLQLRGRHHPLRAAGAGRRAHLHPHRGARGRRP